MIALTERRDLTNRFLSFITWPAWLRTRPRSICAVRILDQFQVHASFTINNGSVMRAKRGGQRGGRSKLWKKKGPLKRMKRIKREDYGCDHYCCHDRHRAQPHDADFIDLLTFASPNFDIWRSSKEPRLVKGENFTPPWSQRLRASSILT